MMLEDLFYVLDMDGADSAARAVDSGQFQRPPDLLDGEWESLKTAAQGAADFFDLMDRLRDKYDIDYF